MTSKSSSATPPSLPLFDTEADWTPREIALGTRYLKKVGAKEYRWPTEEAMHIAHSVMSYWAPEIVIIRGIADPRILLAIYDGGAQFPPNTWHIPGGYNLWPELNIQEAISRISYRELGQAVNYFRIIGDHKWTSEEHPYGHPLSLYCLCHPSVPINETDKLRYFTRSELPQTLIGPHRRFAEALLSHTPIKALDNELYFSD